MSINPYQAKIWLELAALLVGIFATLKIGPTVLVWLRGVAAGLNGFADVPHSLSRLEATISGCAIDISTVREDMSVMKQAFQVRLDSDPTLGYFECDVHGLNTLVNETYRGWVNASNDDLLGMGFLNYIPDDEREEIREEWALCLAERRIYRKRHHLVNLVTGEKFEVDTRVEPVPTFGPVKHWIGTIRKVAKKARRHDD